MNVEELFLKYTDVYAKNNKECRYKVDHSFRVRDISLKIGESINLSVSDLDLLNICAMFHDIGRFEQWEKYNTFVDAKSVNHGEIGYEILSKGELLDQLGLTNVEKDIVLQVVLKHGVLYEDNISEYYKMFIDIVSDADKIDILNSAVAGHILLDVGSDEVSPLVYDNMFNHKLLDMKLKTTKADRLCVWLAFVYGMHFNYSYKYLKENRIMSRLIDIYKIKTSNDVTRRQYETIGKDIDLYLGGKIC